MQNRLDRWQARIYNNVPMAVAVRIYRNLMYDLRMPRLIDFGLLTGYAVVSTAGRLVDLRPPQRPLRRRALTRVTE